jgi:hypothetical protein
VFSPYQTVRRLNFSGEMDYENIARNLEKLLPVIERASQRAEAQSAELTQIRGDLKSMGRLFDIAASGK